MRSVQVGIIGTGWCGGIRAQTCAAHPLVGGLHIAEIRPDRLAEVAAATSPRTATTDYRELLKIDEIDAYYLHHPREPALPDGARVPAGRQARVLGEADGGRVARSR
ncbi:MAG TPA: hypothetical protein VEH53_07835 [archaeon]|nr:hypothetical protein [archaeon]